MPFDAADLDRFWELGELIDQGEDLLETLPMNDPLYRHGLERWQAWLAEAMALETRMRAGAV